MFKTGIKTDGLSCFLPLSILFWHSTVSLQEFFFDKNMEAQHPALGNSSPGTISCIAEIYMYSILHSTYIDECYPFEIISLLRNER